VHPVVWSCVLHELDETPVSESFPYNATALGQAVAAARQAAGLTLDGLAQRSGISRRMIVDIEQGRKSCTVKTLHAIAHAVSVPVGTLADSACGHELKPAPSAPDGL
jgi:transcriptional regulator with XRE-family HTH domain